jgi:hypothetical protein
MSKITDKLPKELRTNYKLSRKSSPIVEYLKVVAALKLWGDRSYRDIQFEVPLALGGKTVFVKVLAQDADGVVGVECASGIDFGWLRRRIELLRGCLPTDSYLIAIFPSAVDERVDRVAELVDEVWVTGKDNTRVARMMFTSVFGKLE